MDLIHKIESLRYDIENGVVTDVISISVRLIQIKDQALQLQQTGVMARCNIDLVGKELEYISPITKATTIKLIAKKNKIITRTIPSETSMSSGSIYRSDEKH